MTVSIVKASGLSWCIERKDAEGIHGERLKCFGALAVASEPEGLHRGAGASLHGKDEVDGIGPVSLGEVVARPVRWMVRVGVVKAEDFLVLRQGQRLKADQFGGINGVAVSLGDGVR
uniref:Uncharacterized protein n=1 Tax=mine drainage metagenome TaxID=410659 RepID=E6PYT2_9ZZZZ